MYIKETNRSHLWNEEKCNYFVFNLLIWSLLSYCKEVRYSVLFLLQYWYKTENISLHSHNEFNGFVISCKILLKITCAHREIHYSKHTSIQLFTVKHNFTIIQKLYWIKYFNVFFKYISSKIFFNIVIFEF